MLESSLGLSAWQSDSAIDSQAQFYNTDADTHSHRPDESLLLLKRFHHVGSSDQQCQKMIMPGLNSPCFNMPPQLQTSTQQWTIIS